MTKTTTIKTPRNHQVRLNTKLYEYIKGFGEHASDGLERVLIEHKRGSISALSDANENLQKEIANRAKRIETLEFQNKAVANKRDEFAKLCEEHRLEITQLEERNQELASSNQNLKKERGRIKKLSEEDASNWEKEKEGLEAHAVNLDKELATNIKESVESNRALNKCIEDAETRIAAKDQANQHFQVEAANLRTSKDSALLAAAAAKNRASTWKIAGVLALIVSLSFTLYASFTVVAG